MGVGATVNLKRGWGGDAGTGSDVGLTALANLPAFPATLFLQHKINIKGKALFRLIGLPVG